MSNPITPAIIDGAMSYQAYRELIDQLLLENRVTGDFMDNNEDIIGYTKMSVARMKRGDKTFSISESLSAELEKSKTPWLWLVMTEGWCGDASQIVPALVKIAAANSRIEMKFILRDEHPKVMDEYLTEGGRSIPKLIVLNPETLEVIGDWGPRPEPAQAMTRAFKLDDSLDYTTYSTELHKWYAKDRYNTIQEELLAKVKEWNG